MACWRYLALSKARLSSSCYYSLNLLRINHTSSACTFTLICHACGVIGCQVTQLLDAGADLLAAVSVGPQRQIGTAVDYAHYVYSLASTPRPTQHLSDLPFFAITDTRCCHIWFLAASGNYKSVFCAKCIVFNVVESAVQRHFSATDTVKLCLTCFYPNLNIKYFFKMRNGSKVK